MLVSKLILKVYSRDIFRSPVYAVNDKTGPMISVSFPPMSELKFKTKSQ